MEKEHKQSVYFGKEDDKRRGVDYVMKMIFGFYKECLELEPKYKINNDEGGSASEEGFTLYYIRRVRKFIRFSLGRFLDEDLAGSFCFFSDIEQTMGVEWTINLGNKSIMGINGESAQVIQAAAKLGCLVLKCPFYYLGTRVGGSLPVFHMSIFTVNSKGLHILESIRRNGLLLAQTCWLTILSEVRSLQAKEAFLRHFFQVSPRLNLKRLSTVSSKIGTTCLVCSFRRIPRGGIEQNQFDSLVGIGSFYHYRASGERRNWNRESCRVPIGDNAIEIDGPFVL
ncbi:hypothetical protein Tco_0864050 [Tanacetum coccineum]